MSETSFSYLLNELKILFRNTNFLKNYEVKGCDTTRSILKNKYKSTFKNRSDHELICYGAKNVRIVTNLTISHVDPFILYKPNRLILRALIISYHRILRALNILSILNKSSIFLISHHNSYKYRIISIYVGTDAPSRKIVLFIESDNSKDVLKYGSSMRAQQSLKHEFQTLHFLIDTQIAKYIPKTKILVLGNDQIATLTPYLPNTQKNSNYNNLVEEFLIDLSQINFSTSEYMIETLIAEKLQNKEEWVIDILVDKFQSQPISIANHLAHGDFADWNIRIVKDTLTVLDWEYSMISAPLGVDLFYFNFSQILTAGHTPKNIKRKIHSVSRDFNRIYNKAVFQYDFEMYFAIWLLSLKKNEKNGHVIQSLMESLVKDEI